MAPDIDSLSPPQTTSTSTTSPSGTVLTTPQPRRISTSLSQNTDAFRPSPPSPSLSSLQAAATINAGLQRSPSNNRSPARNSGTTTTGLERRRSSLMHNLDINDPAVPGPGELQSQHQSSGQGSNGSSPRLGRRTIAYGTADPHHQRQPSLGEIHQELENEQEAQVNRLLHMIRIQQDQIAQIQRQQQQSGLGQEASSESSSAVADTPAGLPTPPPSSNLNPAVSNSTLEHPSPRSSSISNLPHPQGPFNRPHSLSRQSSSRISNAGSNTSRSGSPGLRPHSGSLGPLTEDFLLGGTRDESAFYQAETQMLVRENQMLRQRIRELERQVSDLSLPSQTQTQLHLGGQSHNHSPAQNSPLATTPATFSGETVPALTAEVEPGAKVD